MSAQEYWTVTNGARQLLTAWEEPIGRLRLIAHNEAAVRDYPPATTVPAGVEGLSGSTYGPWLCGRASLPPGHYHPRIQRELGPAGLPAYQKTPPIAQQLSREVAAARQSASNLFVQLDELFRHVHPAPENGSSYGDRIRSLLILACTETESAWKAVGRANGMTKSILSTKDYVRLARPMRLAEWSLRLSSFPEYPPLRPFDGWDAATPTQSLPWYDAYNAAKHDRENALRRATLGHVIAAMAGVHVMLAAQFGCSSASTLPASPFAVDTSPEWDVAEFYVPPLPGANSWTARALFV